MLVLTFTSPGTLILGYILWLIIYNVQLVTSKQCLKIYISELENSKYIFKIVINHINCYRP